MAAVSVLPLFCIAERTVIPTPDGFAERVAPELSRAESANA